MAVRSELLTSTKAFFGGLRDRAWFDDPDVTGNPWPDCVCNDVRYDEGHMESCPRFGYSPDIAWPEESLDRLVFLVKDDGPNRDEAFKEIVRRLQRFEHEAPVWLRGRIRHGR